MVRTLDHRQGRPAALTGRAGLSAEQLRRRAVAPASLTPLGLARHLADAERGCCHNVVAGEDVPAYFPENEAARGRSSTSRTPNRPRPCGALRGTEVRAALRPGPLDRGRWTGRAWGAPGPRAPRPHRQPAGRQLRLRGSLARSRRTTATA
ncbi:DUF664 domain-containing protein [Streptomyces sp. NPDC058701]|uniref:mycothiol transferase n=1 Tax=Streptomyces sp. NPDC058701 TaxID=3346608 RepID=UPI00365BACDA